MAAAPSLPLAPRASVVNVPLFIGEEEFADRAMIKTRRERLQSLGREEVVSQN